MIIGLFQKKKLKKTLKFLGLSLYTWQFCTNCVTPLGNSKAKNEDLQKFSIYLSISISLSLYIYKVFHLTHKENIEKSKEVLRKPGGLSLPL